MIFLGTNHLLTTANNPKIHSFRVVAAGDAQCNKLSFTSLLNGPEKFGGFTNDTDSILSASPAKITKPILMCFVCKLSFGNTKSFGLHANAEHSLNLQESDKILLSRDYSSAILQRSVDEKPQISFLEPFDSHQLIDNKNENTQKSKLNTVCDSSTPSPITRLSPMCESPKISNNQFVASNDISNSNLDQDSAFSDNATDNKNSSRKKSMNASESTGKGINNKITNDFPNQPQQSMYFKHDRLTPSTPLNASQQNFQFQELKHKQEIPSQPTFVGCPIHLTGKGIDCKACEMLECSFPSGVAVDIKSPLTPSKSPNNPCHYTSSSPTLTLAGSPTNQPAPSFTIGACPEHVNGRPFGIDCAR